MLTAAFITAVLVSGAQAAAPSPPTKPLAWIEVEPPGPYPNNSPYRVLARVDPVTLRPRSPMLDLGRHGGGLTLARSPDGKRAVVPAGGRTVVVDLRTMRPVSTFPVTGRLYAWPSPRRVVMSGLSLQRVTVVDPMAGAVLATHDFRADWFETVRVRGGLAAVVGSLGAPIRVLQFRPGKRREIPIRSLWLGLETRRAGAHDILPSGARAALESARAEVARTENVPLSAVKGLAVTPDNFPTTARGCPLVGGQPAVSPGYQVIVRASGRNHDYRAGLRGGRARFCRHGSAPSARNLLRAGRGVDVVRGATLAADPGRDRVFVLAPEGIMASVRLDHRSVRLRKIAALPQGGTEELEDGAAARWVGEGRVVYWLAYASQLSPSGVVIDARTGRVLPLVAHGCYVDARVGLVLVYGPRCRGLDARLPSGPRRFRLFASGPPVFEVDRTRRYAYVHLGERSFPNPPRKLLHVIDLTRGAVVGQVDVGFSTRVISE